MKHTFLALAAAGFLLAGCSPAPSAGETATCIANAMPAQELIALAEAGGNPHLGRMTANSCAGAGTFILDGSYRAAVEKEFPKAAQARAEYRSAVYGVLPGVTAPAAKARARELGSLLERVAVNRRDIQACRMADPAAVATVSELDATFTLAALALHAGVQDLDTAKAAGKMLTGLVASNAAKRPAQACSPELEKNFRTDVQEWASFYEGKHPWLQGCFVTAEADAFVLKCR